jgi:hypothetical protein
VLGLGIASVRFIQLRRTLRRVKKSGDFQDFPKASNFGTNNIRGKRQCILLFLYQFHIHSLLFPATLFVPGLPPAALVTVRPVARQSHEMVERMCLLHRTRQVRVVFEVKFSIERGLAMQHPRLEQGTPLGKRHLHAGEIKSLVVRSVSAHGVVRVCTGLRRCIAI